MVQEARHTLRVIPGRDEGASPESIRTMVVVDSGLALAGAPE
jgi:hypothetical protein